MGKSATASAAKVTTMGGSKTTKFNTKAPGGDSVSPTSGQVGTFTSPSGRAPAFGNRGRQNKGGLGRQASPKNPSI